MQLVTIAWQGRPCFHYATNADAGTANATAGQLIDRLVDCYGLGFGYAVRPLHCHYPSVRPFAGLFDAARQSYELGLEEGVAYE
jgi:hypothetical protein